MKIKLERRKAINRDYKYPRMIRVTEVNHQKLKELSSQTGIPVSELANRFLAAASEEVLIVD